MQRTMQRTRLFGLLVLMALLVSVYTLTSSGRFHIIDEVSLFSLTESAALRGAVDTNAIAWTQWVNSPGEVLGAFGPDGQVYSKKGPAPALLALPWYLLLHAITELKVGIGQLQTTLLWNGFVTAATAALLWLVAGRLGFSDRTGMLLGLLFGLATIAWPYANQFFGEPLSAFSLLLLFYALLGWRRHPSWGWMLLAGSAAGLAVATVTAHALLVLVLAGWWLADGLRRRQLAPAARWSAVGAFALPLAFTVLLLGIYNTVRFGHPLETGYHFDAGEGFTTPLPLGLWGLLVSPYRGLFWHTPLLLAAWAAFVPFVRRLRSEGILIALLSAVLIITYSLWWMWWGGFAWGPRFLVPLTPFWLLWLAPVLEEAVRQPRRWARSVSAWLVALLALLSAVVQLAAVSVNFVNYEIALRGLYPTDWNDPLRHPPPAQSLANFLDSPVFGQFKLMAQGFVTHSDLAWLWATGEPAQTTVLWLVVLIGGAAVLTLAGGVLVWWKATSAPHTSAYTIGAPTFVLAAVIPALVISTWAGEVERQPDYGQSGNGYRAILSEICSSVTESDSFVNVAPAHYQIPMNWMPGACQTDIATLGYALNSLAHPETAQVLEQVARKSDRIWFVTSGVQANDPDNTLERWLADHAYKATDSWYGDFRLLQYATAVRLAGVEATPVNQALLGRRAEQVTVFSARSPSVGLAGKPLPIEIEYRLEAPTDQNLRWFVQLLSGQNIPLALLDSGPNDNYTLFSSLPAREILVERAGLLVPANTPEGDYLLIAGLYNPDDEAARLITIDGPDFVSLGAVRVVKAR